MPNTQNKLREHFPSGVLLYAIVPTKGCTSLDSEHFSAEIASIKAGRCSLSQCQCRMSLDAAAFWQQQNTRLTFSLEAHVLLGRNTMWALRGARHTQSFKSVQWGKRVFSSFACKASGSAQTFTGELVSKRLLRSIPTWRRWESRRVSFLSTCKVFVPSGIIWLMSCKIKMSVRFDRRK